MICRIWPDAAPQSSWRNELRLSVCIAVLFSLFLAVGETSFILDMTPPISRLALAGTTVWTVNVTCLMCAAAMLRRALVLIGGID